MRAIGGEVRVLLLNTDPAETFRVEPGDRIAQLVIAPVALAEPVEVESLARVRSRRRRLRLQRPLAAADPKREPGGGAVAVAGPVDREDAEGVCGRDAGGSGGASGRA